MLGVMANKFGMFFKVATIFSLVSLAAFAGEGGDSKAAECVARDGLPNFLKKCEEGKDIKIAYLGGSITAQEGWRVQSLALFRKLYPKAKFEEINAAIGGTGSDFGVYRLQKDVLNFKPDLLFVEFATNDGNRRDTKYMESIVRNTWKTFPACDICFVYTVAGNKAQAALENGELYTAARAHEAVASHYGIPTIHMGVKAAELARAGKLEWKAKMGKMEQVSGDALNIKSDINVNSNGKIPFSRDGVHPYLDTGHKLYTEAIANSIPKIKDAGKQAALHDKLPAPITNDNIDSCTYYDMSMLNKKGEWADVSDPAEGYKFKGADRLPSIWRGAPGAELSFEFTGKSILLYMLKGPGSGQIEIDIDGQKQKLRLFDAWSSYWRLSANVIKSGLSPAKVHSIKIKVLAEEFDKEEVFKQYKQEKRYAQTPKEAYKPIDCLLAGVSIEGGEIKSK